jgi:cob(I)alamin adenosyltransferase
MKIYTKTGDKGTTSLIGGTRVPKDHARIEAYGTVDELSAFIGLLGVQTTDKDDSRFLQNIQQQLFTLGAMLAADGKKTAALADNEITAIENETDRISALLPPLKSFVLAGGNAENALCNVCRTIARRAERRIVGLQKDSVIDENIVKFINRLSDYFFVLGRKFIITANKNEIFWEK